MLPSNGELLLPPISCNLLMRGQVDGSGSASPPTVSLPGAYDSTDPGILINIYQTLTTYDCTCTVQASPSY